MVVNAWHHRSTGVYLAANHPLIRVQKMLDGMQRLTGAPVPRRKRIGVRPEHMQRAISARYGIDARSAHMIQIGQPCLRPRDRNPCSCG